jgi:hypothetical protein
MVCARFYIAHYYTARTIVPRSKTRNGIGCTRQADNVPRNAYDDDNIRLLNCNAQDDLVILFA